MTDPEDVTSWPEDDDPEMLRGDDAVDDNDSRLKGQGMILLPMEVDLDA